MIAWLLDLIPWWAWAAAAVALALLVVRLIGVKAGLAVLAASLPLIAYRKGRDDQSGKSYDAFRKQTLETQTRIDDQARIARDRARAASQRVRDAAGGDPARKD